MRWSHFILARIAVRTVVALWRHRAGMLVGTIMLGGVGAYQLSFAGSISPNADCADTTMAAVTHANNDAARAAYACLGPTMRSTTEDAFVADMHQRVVPRGQVNRVGDQRTRDGGRIVFFTVEHQGQAIGYIVYLHPTGNVIRVE